MHSGPKHDDNFENNMGGSIIYSGGGIGITADPGQNSYDPRLMVQIGKFFWIIPIILVKMWGFDPPGSPYMVLPPLLCN